MRSIVSALCVTQPAIVVLVNIVTIKAAYVAALWNRPLDPFTSTIDWPSKAGTRSNLALTSFAYTRIGQSERRVAPAPIMTPGWSYLPVFALIHFPASFVRLWPSRHFHLGGPRHARRAKWSLQIHRNAHELIRTRLLFPLSNLDFEREI